MTRTELRILKLLSEGDFTSSQIAERLNQPRPSVRRTLAAMYREGHVVVVCKIGVNGLKPPYVYAIRL